MPPIPLPNPFSTRYFPPTSAGPEEIRRYIIQILATKHDVPVPEAEGIASKWTVERGDVFREIVDWTGWNGVGNWARELLGESVSGSLLSGIMEDWWHSSEGATVYYVQALGVIASCILTRKAIRAARSGYPKIWRRDFSIAFLILTLVMHYCRLFELNPRRRINAILVIPMTVVTLGFWADSCDCAGCAHVSSSRGDPSTDRRPVGSCSLVLWFGFGLTFAVFYYVYWVFSFVW